MLNQTQIPIGKLKQAYGLSGNEIDALMAELLPGKVFPYALWKNAYDEFWRWSIQATAQGYRVEEPQFPDAGPLPEKYFTTSLHTTLITRFFADISRVIEIAALEKGFDYIIEATFGDDFPFREQKESLFRSLHEEENRPENWQRTSGKLNIDSFQSVDHSCVSASFLDTVVVDKQAALKYIISSGYSFHKEVKGISRALIEHTSAEVFSDNKNTAKLPQTAVSNTKPDTPQSGSISVPRSLWEGKSPQAICKNLRQADFGDALIAHVLFHKCGLKSQRAVAKLICQNTLSEAAYDKHGKQLFEDSLLIAH